MTQHSITNLSATAFWTAAVRARESKREDRLFYDPWAVALAGEKGAAWIGQRTDDSLVPMIVRTRYFDDFLVRTCTQHELKQVVILASGLDTRAFRLTWHQGVRLFELDQPGVMQYKEAVLGSLGAGPTCERVAIGVDLTSSWKEALIANGFNPQEPSCWLLEGFLFYLPEAAIVELFDQTNMLAAPESWMGFDIVNQAVLTFPFTKPWVDMQALWGAPWIGTLEDPKSFLAARGWTANLTQGGQPDANYGRWVLPVIPTEMPGMPHNWFVIAEKT